MQHIFSERDISSPILQNLQIDNADAKRKILQNWISGLVSGKIMSQNEKKLQSEFLNKIFGDVLGYAYEKHLDKWNLENELKVALDGRTPDGALGYFSFENGSVQQDIRVVIELKSPLCNLDKKQNRADFKGTPVEQAFSYVPKLAKPCNWVIVSNCQEIRLYRYALGMSQYQGFDLIELLNGSNFHRFCYVLQAGQLFLEKSESAVEQLFNKRQEELKNITNQFYEQYRQHRQNLFDQVRKHNPAISHNNLLRHTQKLIDRLIFMCFVRDLDLVSNMLDEVRNTADRSFGQEEDKIWQELKKAFAALDKGYARKNIPPFNGGLFRADDELQNLNIKDFRLDDVLRFLSSYNYRNQLNVNVLGHIFEQSISDIEEMKQDEDNPEMASSSNTNISKRKTEGVFYTPEYITNYIVEQAVGGWLNEREAEILQKMGVEQLPELLEEDYRSIDPTKASIGNDAVRLHLRFWEEYETALKSIKVLDPACGSGAFLTQVFDYLWGRWQVLKQETNRLTTPYEKQLAELQERNGLTLATITPPTYSEWLIKKDIIQHNLFGVDLNPESVEITKLSLWLKTANRKEKLANMDGNIWHGNSLVADAKLSPVAFVWADVFADVMAKGGFDVVVGNPPYVRQELLGKENKAYYAETFKNVGNGTADLYVYFYELGIRHLNPKGWLAYITPNKWFKTKYGRELREFLKPLGLWQIIDFFELKIFEDAATEPQIIILKKQQTENDFLYFPITNTQHFIQKTQPALRIKKANLQTSEWVFANPAEQSILEKMEQNAIQLGDYGKMFRGVLTGLNKAFIIDKSTKEKICVADARSADLIKPYSQATDIKAWHLENKEESFLIFTRRGTDIEKYPAIKKHLMNFYDDLKPKTNENDEIGRKAGTYKWFEIQDSVDYFPLFDTPKILFIYTAVNHYFYYDTENHYVNNSCFFISNADLFLSAWLNSQVFEFYKRLKFVAYGNAEERGRCKLDYNKMVHVPIPNLSEAQKAPFIAQAQKLQQANEAMHQSNQNFWGMVQVELQAEKRSERLQRWYELSFQDFVAEIKKQKGNFGTLSKQAQWQIFFKEQQGTAQQLQKTIKELDIEINEMVFDLYDFSPEEKTIFRLYGR